MEKKILAFNFKNNLVDENVYEKIASKQKVEVIVLPSFLQISGFEKFQNQFSLGSQNVQINQNGTYTGEITAKMLKQYGVKYCLVGHSERRIKGFETNEICSDKISALEQENITPILCVGEREKLEFCDAEKFVIAQIKQSTISRNKVDFSNLIVAYEPVFSIGTGQVCEKSHIEQMVQSIKLNFPFCKVLYGGSVNETNFESLLSLGLLDGLLIGGASLIKEKVEKICSIN